MKTLPCVSVKVIRTNTPPVVEVEDGGLDSIIPSTTTWRLHLLIIITIYLKWMSITFKEDEPEIFSVQNS